MQADPAALRADGQPALRGIGRRLAGGRSRRRFGSWVGGPRVLTVGPHRRGWEEGRQSRASHRGDGGTRGGRRGAGCGRGGGVPGFVGAARRGRDREGEHPEHGGDSREFHGHKSSCAEVMVTAMAGGPSAPPPATPPLAILSRVARPSGWILPKMVYSGGSSVSLYTRKNWLPLVFGPLLAIAKVPRG